MDANIQAAATRLVRKLKSGGFSLTIAESCTGGLLASTLTDITGASAWFRQSWVTYANEAKIEVLGVDPDDLNTRGAVSAKVAIQMAQGALKAAKADYAISVTGIAGPTNEGSSKPVGTVYVGIASRFWAEAKRTQIGGTRAENKNGFVHFALRTAMECFEAAMNREIAEGLEAEMAELEAQRKKAEMEAERERRDQEARENAPWQDEAWSEGDGETSDKIGLEVEWSDSEE
jgi:nicotinamide-nucleotide amidase